MGMVSKQMLMRTPSTPLLPGICTYSFHCMDHSPRNLQACSSPPVRLCAMLPCFQGLLWLFQPDPCIVYNLFLIYQSLASLISPQIASSSLYLPHSFMGFHTWKWVLMDWDLRCRPWKWDLYDELCSTANGIIGALCHWKSSRHICFHTKEMIRCAACCSAL